MQHCTGPALTLCCPCAGPVLTHTALVIYYFLALCFEYLGGESAILAALRDRENVPSWYGALVTVPLGCHVPWLLCRAGTAPCSGS